MRLKTPRITHVQDPSKLEDGLAGELVSISRRGFGKQMSANEVMEHIVAANMLQLIHLGEDLVGFASYMLYDVAIRNGGRVPRNRSVLYLSGTVFDEGVQGLGLSPFAIREALKETDPHALALRTQNPAMYSAMMKVAGSRIFPSVSGIAPEPEAVHIAKELAEILRERNFDETSFTDQKTYGRALNRSVPKVREEIERLFGSLRMARDAGDSLILVALLRD